MWRLLVFNMESAERRCAIELEADSSAVHGGGNVTFPSQLDICFAL